MYKLKISIDNEPIVKARAEHLEDFDNIFIELKKKLGGGKR